MKKILLVFAMMAASLLLAQPASAADQDQVCPDLSTGKIGAGGNQTTLTIEAPEGFLIDFYCVKAGSAEQGEGPEIVQVNPPAEKVTISHPSGKGISHYSVHYIKETPPPDNGENGENGENGNGNGAPGNGKVPADEDRVLPATGGLPLWVLLIAGPMTAAGLVVLRRQWMGHASTSGPMRR